VGSSSIAIEAIAAARDRFSLATLDEVVMLQPAPTPAWAFVSNL
jgi:hypothetical protein